MKQRDLEKLFRDRLKNDRPQVDTDKLWDNISSELPGKRRKRRIAIFWWFGLIGLTLIATGIWLWPKAPINVETGQNTIVADPVHEADEAVASDTINEIAEYKSFTERQVNGQLSSQDVSEHAFYDQDVERNESKTVASTDRYSDPGLLNSADSKQMDLNRKRGSGTNQKASQNSLLNDVTIANANDALSEKVDLQTTVEPDIAERPFVGRNVNSVTGLIPLIVNPEFEYVSEWPLLDKNGFASSMIPDNTGSNASHWVGLFGGPGVTSRKLLANGPEGDLTRIWKDSLEQLLENWTLGFQYRFQKDQWFAEASISGQWINEKSSFTSVYDTSRILDNVVIEQVIENGQVIEERRGAITVFERTETSMITYSKLVHLSAALGIGRLWEISPKLDLVTRAGALYSLTSKYRGTVLDPDGKTYDLEKDIENKFREDGMKWGGYGALELQWSPMPQWALSGGIQARFMPGGISAESSQVDQSYQTYSLQFGIYRIF